MKKIIVCLLSVTFLIFLCSCSVIRLAAQSFLKAAVIDQTVLPVSAAPLPTGPAPTGSWKAEIPAYMPKFEYGTYSSGHGEI